jgi:ubiquinone/menaquinone biosynthesis C-methylase UbiE
MLEKANRYKEITKKSFDKKSACYEETWDGRYCRSMYVGLLEKIKAQPFHTVLDVGCGTGTMLSILKNEFKNIEICGIDLSDKMIEKAYELVGESAELVVGDAENLPWQESSFDLVICNASFHHYPQPLKVIGEMKRVLRPDGRVIIADPWWSLTKRFLINFFLDSPLNYLGDVRIYSEKEMYDLLTAGGFINVQWETPSGKYSISTATA